MAPYHPSSNGLAERAVQIVKKGLRKNKKGTFRTRLSHTLFSYRITPQSTTSVSPAELLLGRRPRSKLDLLRPNLAERVEKKQQSQKELHDSRSRERAFDIGTKVWVRNMQRGDKWLPGTIVSKEGSVTYHVEMRDGRVRKCHTDQIRVRTGQATVLDLSNSSTLPLSSDTDLRSNVTVSDPPSEPSNESESPTVESDLNRSTSSNEQLPEDLTEQTQVETSAVPPTSESELRRSNRARNPVNRYEPQW